MRINLPFISVMALAVGFSLISCASKPAESSEKSVKDIEVVETPEEPKVENFVDWQFKGFGKEVPESAERVFAFVNSDSQITDGIIIEADYYIFYGKGSNSDQCVNVLEAAFDKHLSTYEENHEAKELSLVEDYWVKVNQEVWNTDKPYMAIRIFEIN